MQRLICALLGLASSQLVAAAPTVHPYDTQDALMYQGDDKTAHVEKFLVETAPGVTKWVTEEGKLDLIRVCILQV
jgi:hypothetical protein